MTMPRFRSTAAFSTRQRPAVPHVERATFVVFSLAGRRLAAPVEAVERVLRQAAAPSSAERHVVHAGRHVPLIDLRPAFGVPSPAPDDASRRLLIFSAQGVWLAAEVDAVHDVATVDASSVESLGMTGHDAMTLVGARGRFVRHGHEVIVLDMLRVVRAVYQLAQRATPDDAHDAGPHSATPAE